MSASPRAPIAITMGDPAGVGPEIIVRLACMPREGTTPLLVIGDIERLRATTARLGLALTLVPIQHPGELDMDKTTPGRLAVLPAGPPLPSDLPHGQVDARAGAAAYAYVSRAIDFALDGSISAIVTAPLNKAAMAAAGIPYPGHTEILADRAGTQDFGMMLANDELRVMLVSIHLSLRQAIDAVTPERELRAIRLAARACHAYGIDHPRIAVAGLNPHAGEGGLFGGEDDAIIAPAIARAREEGIDASGPWPGDTVFMNARRGHFDAVVAQYHDQGLIPVKYLGVDNGVNITVGLPFVRTSVDHGTAFDIAGQGIADPSSLLYALKQAEAMVSAGATNRPVGCNIGQR
ncbi:4-hydroxythreonine-4-phosphate dehydrogenase PdxA [Kushneria marisflavi]|uniref:4-hydroxythreonine-4-phosphate dehydrogenase n=1 Tax=Kushneria marisflavi TaxID=157779 RepID=A0A240UQV9_9GAMM|nr:4-hydroxythreonine-4-phosphate dehydrogenase PdxA [Kushneria marisflavi]ART63410.1 4-hydroxythreonine-4-phosphate dehydrogenase PdxA [Kushneria marisflavi]RKD84465.1 4-hydroxythreonine-4-phosphate dehydrogenase [Kushneria marisflavi]